MVAVWFEYHVGSARLVQEGHNKVRKALWEASTTLTGKVSPMFM